eukprot:3603161-Prymnesium_polylepis.2
MELWSPFLDVTPRNNLYLGNRIALNFWTTARSTTPSTPAPLDSAPAREPVTPLRPLLLMRLRGST